MKVDYTTFGNAGDPTTDQNFDKRWWLVPQKDRAASITKVVNTLAQYDTRRQKQYQISTRLYGNTGLTGTNGLSLSSDSSYNTAIKDRVTYNVAQSCVDTITSKIAKNKPKPLFLTSGGDIKMQRKAKKLDKFVDGVFYENNAHKLAISIFRDAAVLGDGLAQVFRYHNRVKAERALASELFVDPIESLYGRPMQLHRVKSIDRQVLIDLFPSKKDAIRNANSPQLSLTTQAYNVSDQIIVGESWRLPSSPDSDDGMHCIWLENKMLTEEKYTKQYFPFARFQWASRMDGYWGQGGVEQIQSIQLEINKLLWVIQRSMHLSGTFKVWLKTGSKIPKEHINNEIGAIIMGEEAPQYLVPPIVPPELYNHLQTLKNQAFEQFGISQLSATSTKPSGLNSGKALREYNDIETDRFMTTGQAFEQLHLDFGRLAIDVAKEIYQDEKNYSVRVPGRKFIETIDWKDIDLEDDSYIMKAFPISSLPQEPAGRLQTIQEYMQAGFIDPVTGRKLLDFPDLETIESLYTAQEDWILKYLDAIVDDGEYKAPEPEMRLDQALQYVIQYIAQGSVNNLDPDRMNMLRTFKKQVETLIKKAMPPQPMGAPGGEPLAVPAPPAQSELLPNIPQ